MFVRNLKKVTLSSAIRFGVYFLFVYSVFFVGIIIFLYLSNFNTSTTKGYELSRLEKERQDLLLKVEKLQLEMSEARALLSIQERAQNLYMISKKEPVFVRLGNAVAKK